MELLEFVKLFTSKSLFKEEDIISKSNNYYLVSPRQKNLFPIFKERPFSAGIFLGMASRPTFIPSFQLLDILCQNSERKLVLNEKSAWLFICGRDVLNKGISTQPRNLRPDDLVLLESKNGECLGFGKWVQNQRLAVKNLLDRGDFLRRERNRMRSLNVQKSFKFAKGEH